VAHLVVGAKGIRGAPGATAAPEAQVVVRKTFDPGGALFSRELLSEKMQAGRALRGDPRFAEQLSRQLGRGARGGRYIIYERAKGIPIGDVEKWPGGLKSWNDVHKQVGGMRDAFSGRGRYLEDVVGHPGNVLVAPSGPGLKATAIDYLPVRRGVMEDIEKGTAPWQKKLEGQRLRLKARLGTDPGGRPFMLRAQAGWFQHGFGTPTAASDVTSQGLRRASSRRALSGL
jgi:hypothetical protein